MYFKKNQIPILSSFKLVQRLIILAVHTYQLIKKGLSHKYFNNESNKERKNPFIQVKVCLYIYAYTIITLWKINNKTRNKYKILCYFEIYFLFSICHKISNSFFWHTSLSYTMISSYCNLCYYLCSLKEK